MKDDNNILDKANKFDKKAKSEILINILYLEQTLKKLLFIIFINTKKFKNDEVTIEIIDNFEYWEVIKNIKQISKYSKWLKKIDLKPIYLKSVRSNVNKLNNTRFLRNKIAHQPIKMKNKFIDFLISCNISEKNKDFASMENTIKTIFELDSFFKELIEIIEKNKEILVKK